MDASHLKFIPVPCERRANMNYIRPNPLEPMFKERVPKSHSSQNDKTFIKSSRIKKEEHNKTQKPNNLLKVNNFSNISVKMKDLGISLNTSTLDKSLVNFSKINIPKADTSEFHPKFNKKDKLVKANIKHKKVELGYMKPESKLQDVVHKRANSNNGNSTFGISFYINNTQNVIINCEDINIDKDNSHCYDNTFYKAKRRVLLPNMRMKQLKDKNADQSGFHGSGKHHKVHHLDILNHKDSFEELLEKLEGEIKNPEDPFAEKNAKFEEYYKNGYFKF